MYETYPISIRDVAPGPDAVRLTGRSRSGGADGFHTGGVWLMGDKVYKPLDGRPYANANCHIGTREAELLELMAHQPFFPRNWTIEVLNGRRFLVRDVAQIIEPDQMPLRHLLKLEQVIRKVNSLGWEINDDIVIASDTQRRLFILDLSAAQRYPQADDLGHLHRFLENAGENGQQLLNLRRRGKGVIASGMTAMLKADELTDDQVIEYMDYHHVYASFNRPLSHVHDIECYLVKPDGSERPCKADGVPYTWLVTDLPLAKSECDRYELEWVWSPIEYEHGGS